MRMKRTISITVDKNTWPSPPLLPTYPASFGAKNQSFDVNILELLLLIGYLTTPSHASGVSLSEFWAWARYLHAMTNDADLRLTSAFYELDAHQKTILSDDFGMGISIYWLFAKLNLEQIVDGRYFIDRMLHTVNATATRSQKRGPSKSPDFVARDANGIWHVIECKGTQTSTNYRIKQLNSAITQKKTITFPNTNSGQRLACGLLIGIQGGGPQSNLLVIDPPDKNDIVIGAKQLPMAEDAVARAVSARSLRLAGFGALASAISAPMGREPWSQPSKGRREAIRQELVEEKRTLATAELSNIPQHEAFTADGRRYRGRQVQIDLPVPIVVGGKLMRSVRIRSGISVDFLDELREYPLIEGLIQEKINSLKEPSGHTNLSSRGRSARLNMGASFVSEISFYP